MLDPPTWSLGKISNLEAGTLSLEHLEGWMLEVRSWKLETRASRLEAGGERFEPQRSNCVEIENSNLEAGASMTPAQD